MDALKSLTRLEAIKHARANGEGSVFHVLRGSATIGYYTDEDIAFEVAETAGAYVLDYATGEYA